MSTNLSNYKKDLEAVEFLRKAVNVLGMRDEFLNADKTPVELLNEVNRMFNDETENEEHTFKFWNGRKPEAYE